METHHRKTITHIVLTVVRVDAEKLLPAFVDPFPRFRNREGSERIEAGYTQKRCIRGAGIVRHSLNVHHVTRNVRRGVRSAAYQILPKQRIAATEVNNGSRAFDPSHVHHEILAFAVLAVAELWIEHRA